MTLREIQDTRQRLRGPLCLAIPPSDYLITQQLRSCHTLASTRAARTSGFIRSIASMPRRLSENRSLRWINSSTKGRCAIWGELKIGVATDESTRRLRTKWLGVIPRPPQVRRWIARPTAQARVRLIDRAADDENANRDIVDAVEAVARSRVLSVTQVAPARCSTGPASRQQASVRHASRSSRRPIDRSRFPDTRENSS